MVMDFGFVKDIMWSRIHQPCDHGLILWEQDYEVLSALQSVAPSALMESAKVGHAIGPKWLKLVKLPEVPTAENLAQCWYNEVRDGIIAWGLNHHLDEVKLEAIHVWETPNSLAVYRP